MTGKKKRDKKDNKKPANKANEIMDENQDPPNSGPPTPSTEGYNHTDWLAAGSRKNFSHSMIDDLDGLNGPVKETGDQNSPMEETPMDDPEKEPENMETEEKNPEETMEVQETDPIQNENPGYYTEGYQENKEMQFKALNSETEDEKKTKRDLTEKQHPQDTGSNSTMDMDSENEKPLKKDSEKEKPPNKNQHKEKESESEDESDSEDLEQETDSPGDSESSENNDSDSSPNTNNEETIEDPKSRGKKKEKKKKKSNSQKQSEKHWKKVIKQYLKKYIVKNNENQIKNAIANQASFQKNLMKRLNEQLETTTKAHQETAKRIQAELRRLKTMELRSEYNTYLSSTSALVNMEYINRTRTFNPPPQAISWKEFQDKNFNGEEVEALPTMIQKERTPEQSENNKRGIQKKRMESADQIKKMGGTIIVPSISAAVNEAIKSEFKDEQKEEENLKQKVESTSEQANQKDSKTEKPEKKASEKENTETSDNKSFKQPQNGQRGRGQQTQYRGNNRGQYDGSRGNFNQYRGRGQRYNWNNPAIRTPGPRGRGRGRARGSYAEAAQRGKGTYSNPISIHSSESEADQEYYPGSSPSARDAVKCQWCSMTAFWVPHLTDHHKKAHPQEPLHITRDNFYTDKAYNKWLESRDQ